LIHNIKSIGYWVLADVYHRSSGYDSVLILALLVYIIQY
jgi:hypothetical protein